ncbi:hypothetical protein HPB47_026201 [Ixodes persulcatus]|uniref:Uncharacterized protein n=1 Tax=Ixodes persulcatus TaxID=34615 RepID=A0AC60Q173_IXOPE|nr:hypothetical protein HPB47_026201 [Ixodes persulcatus]
MAARSGSRSVLIFTPCLLSFEDAGTIHTKVVNDRNLRAIATKRLGKTTSVIVLFEGEEVPFTAKYGPSLLQCSIYIKQVDICYECGRLGHRMDVCPDPKNKISRGCGARNPAPNHNCTPSCLLCKGAHSTADKTCRATYKTPYIIKQHHQAKAGESKNEKGH